MRLAVRTEGNRLLFPESVLFKFGTVVTNRINVGYCGVSSNKQKGDFERQKNLLSLSYHEKGENSILFRIQTMVLA